jgi:tellurite resistance protein
MHLDRFAQRYEVDVHELRRWLIEAMVLAATSDGTFDQEESDQIVNVIAAQSEFTGMDGPELRRDLEQAFAAVVVDGPHVRIAALAAALPRYAHRVLAFRVAARVSSASGGLNPDELGFLRELQRTLGIAEADVARAVEDAQEPDARALPSQVEPVEAYLDCLLMAAACDSKFSDTELSTVIAFVISRSEFDGLEEGQIHGYIRKQLQVYANGGIDARLAELAHELHTTVQRQNAYGLAVSMCLADGDPSPAEREFLVRLETVLDLDAEAAESVLRALSRD